MRVRQIYANDYIYTIMAEDGNYDMDINLQQLDKLYHILKKIHEKTGLGTKERKKRREREKKQNYVSHPMPFDSLYKLSLYKLRKALKGSEENK